MRRAFALFVLLLMLITNTELYQLAKLPILLEHYHEHKAGGMSFTAFLKQHYFNGEKQNPDYERDMQLPFKRPSAVSSISFLMSVPEQPLTGILPVPDKKTVLVSRYSEWLPPFAWQDIFQPPRA